MDHLHLNADDSFELIGPDVDIGQALFFGRRLQRQVESEMDKTFFELLRQLDVSLERPDDEITEKDMEQLGSLRDGMVQLILDICQRKAELTKTISMP